VTALAAGARKVRVYTASKLSEGPRWRALAEDWTEVEVVARWPWLVTHEEAAGDESMSRIVEGWLINVADVGCCDVVMVFGEPDAALRGALVEAGMGIALGKLVIVVGVHQAYGTWQFHPQVRRVVSLDAARSLLRLIGSAGDV
jgi:hypothetical protein